MENESRRVSASRYDLMFYLYGAPIFLAGLLSLRCFLRSRLVGGAFFIFCAITLAYIVELSAQKKEGKASFGVFSRFGLSFAVVTVPAVIVIFLGVFHPAWIAAGTVFLLSGHVYLSRMGNRTERYEATTVVICLVQLVLVPLFLLLYYTGAVVSVFFIWLFPAYCVLVSAGMSIITALLPVRILAPILAVVSMVSVLTGLLSEFVL